MDTTSILFNMVLPHLKAGQTVKEWRILYTAATSTLGEEQKIGYLPCAVDRDQADQKWAALAAKQVSLKAALDELELRLDGKKTRFAAVADFFNLKPATTVDTRNLSGYFFKALEAGKAAAVTYDVIAVKFLQFIPGGAKLFNKKEKLIKAEMTESDLIQLYDAVKEALAKKCEENAERDEVFVMNHEDSPMPMWAKDLIAQVKDLKLSVSPSLASGTTDVCVEEPVKAYFVKKSGRKKAWKADEEPCRICGKANHSEKTCFKRLCGKCSGKGHDADQCATKCSKPGSNTKDR